MNVERSRKKITVVMKTSAFFTISCFVLNVFLAIGVHPLWFLNGLVCLTGGLVALRQCRIEENRVRKMELANSNL